MSEQQIHVLFIDASTGKPLGQTHLPAEQLPETFERSTTLSIGGQDWSVTNAEPARAEDFIQAGTLVLTLAKISLVNPKDILYTLPTICDALPALAAGTSRQGKSFFEIHEDDWRQIEFVSTTYESAIDSQLAEIKRIYEEASIDNGDFLAFKEIAIRSQIAAPIGSTIPLNQLLSMFPQERLYEGIAYPKELELIDGGFAFGLAGLTVYGQAKDGLVQALAIHIGPGKSEITLEAASALAALMRTYDLYLIDWCTRTIFPPADAAIQAYFQVMLQARLLPRTLR